MNDEGRGLPNPDAWARPEGAASPGETFDGPSGAWTNRLLVTSEEAARRLSVSRATVYRLLDSRALESITIGRCRRIPVTALTAFIEQSKN